MNDTTMERGLSQVLEQELTRKSDLKPPKPASVDEQLLQFERIEKTILNRLRTEQLAIIAEYEQSKTEIRSEYERKASDAVAKLHEERDQALFNIGEKTAKRLHELTRMSERVGRSS